MVIDGATQLVGLIGWPVEHSLSPVMHNAAFEALGLPWCYVPLPVPPGQVEVAVRGLAALGFRGANVTVPHKRSVMPVLGSIAPDAEALGAVNTLVIGRKPGGETSIGGYNTDAMGFVGALRRGGFEPEDGGHTVVVGAGGAARAVVYGLLRSGRGEITILNRTLDRAQALVSDLGSHPGYASRLRAMSLTTETLVESSRAASLLVHSTPMGMWPHVDDTIWPSKIPIPAYLTVFDLVYTPLETRLLQQARQSGAQVIDGLGMLVRQGALAFDMWTNLGEDLGELAALMRAACERVLER
ncbi:MAG TPA: shikimate dehydrogenase [Anaerolineae bacterium]|nr:shikimate dehydrogenase [Anaerolineae bacterium]